MSKTTKSILTLLLGFIIPFATSFLLDLDLIKTNIARTLLIYLLIIVQMLLAYRFYQTIYKQVDKN